jgi:hypothetical protein
VGRNPETYKTRGCPAMLTNNERLFMIDLVQNKPSLFLSKICERLYDSSGTLLSVEAVHQNLANCLSITLKKAGANNIQKSLVANFSFVDKMKFYPAHWLVFTAKQILLFFIITIHYMILQDDLLVQMRPQFATMISSKFLPVWLRQPSHLACCQSES